MITNWEGYVTTTTLSYMVGLIVMATLTCFVCFQVSIVTELNAIPSIHIEGEQVGIVINSCYYD